MNAKQIRDNLLKIVFQRTLDGDTNFYPEAREAIKAVNEFLKKGDIQAATDAATKTDLSSEIFQEAQKSTSIKNPKDKQ